MNFVVICYLYGALLVYLVTGGADFGAGIVELFTPARDKQHTRELMGRLTSPIWEADHMWLILAVVILFVGFPDLYAQLSTSYFIPVTILLLGIVGRGTSYAFRNGDSAHDASKHADNLIYIASCITTPFFLGVILSSLFAGHPPANQSFAALYVFNWLNPFSLSTGLMTVMFCGYLAMIYSLARFPDERPQMKARLLLLSILFFVAVVLVCYNSLFATRLTGRYPGIPLPTVLVLLTALVLLLVGKTIHGHHPKWALFFVVFPVLVTLLILSQTDDLTGTSQLLYLPLHTNPEFQKTTNALGVILIGSTFLIVPALGYLLYKFELSK